MGSAQHDDAGEPTRTAVQAADDPGDPGSDDRFLETQWSALRSGSRRDRCGGSSTRARAACHGVVVFEGSGGPGNPLATDEDTLQASYAAALAGCPDPSYVVACVSGAGSRDQQVRPVDLLNGLA
jgi:hypothetical protein